MWISLVVSGLIVLFSMLLLGQHVRAWRLANHGGLEDHEEAFLRRQYLRRMRASGLLGILGLAILGELFIQSHAWLLAYWMVVLVIAAWICLLALADWIASRNHWQASLAVSQAQAAALKAEIAKFQLEERKPPDPSGPSDSSSSQAEQSG